MLVINKRMDSVFAILTSATIVSSVIASPVQSQSYRDRVIQQQNQQEDLINKRLEYIAQPFRLARKCFEFSIDSSHLSGIGYKAEPPLLCLKNGGGYFLVVDGLPSGYYKGARLSGNLYGDNGYSWVNSDGHLATASANLLNNDMFILQYSNSYCSATGRFEC